MIDPSNPPVYEPFTVDEFIEGIKELHIGEWKKDYNNPHIIDGIQWTIDIEFEGDHYKPIHIYGEQCFPLQF